MTTPKKHTLLVVDDEPHVGDSVHDLLRREFDVLKARNAEEGVERMREHEVHIVMTDQRMPKITGVELLKRVRVRYPHAVRMLYTGYADFDSIVQAINQGHIFKFLTKPWRAEDLVAAVREAAAEYDRIVEQAEEVMRLRPALQHVRERVTALEERVPRLKGAN